MTMLRRSEVATFGGGSDPWSHALRLHSGDDSIARRPVTFPVNHDDQK